MQYQLASMRTGVESANLVEKHILPITTFRREVFQIPILTDSVFQTQLLPELTANCDHISTKFPKLPCTTRWFPGRLTAVATLASLYGYNLSKH
jgi:hypothetical protein